MAHFFRKLILAISSVTALVCLPASAQDVSQAELAGCAAKPTAAEKLACYEALTAIPAPTPAEPAAEMPPVPKQPAPAAVDSRSSAVEDLGKEQLGIKEEKVETLPITAMVSEVTRSGSGRLYFHFTNGQVWRQIEPRRFLYPKDQEFEVTISQGMMGEYRLRVGGEGSMVRIRRVQ